MKLYREVKTSDRMPPIPDYYNAIRYEDDTLFDTVSTNMLGEEYYAWLEPIEITEEDISNIIFMKYYGTLYPGHGELTEWIYETSEIIMNKLKGE